MNKEQNIIKIEEKFKDKRTSQTLFYIIDCYNEQSECMRASMGKMDYWRKKAKDDYDVDIAHDRSIN